MTEEQLTAKLKQIEDDYGALLSEDIIDVSESELSSSHKMLEKPNAPKSE